MKVWIVEQDDSIAQVLTSAMVSHGFDAYCVPHIDHLCSHSSSDVILLDVPPHSEGRPTPVKTRGATVITLSTCKEQVPDFLKPFDVHELLDRISFLAKVREER